jgi:hypothetical protein
MKTIWKFKLQTTDEQQILMPKGSEILTVQIQDGEPCIWAMINEPNAEAEKRYIEVFGTGNPILSHGPRKYIGTYQLRGGALVFHVFEYTGLFGGPGSDVRSEGEQLGDGGSAKSVCGGVRNCNGNGIDDGLGYCIYCEEKIPSA